LTSLDRTKKSKKAVARLAGERKGRGGRDFLLFLIMVWLMVSTIGISEQIAKIIDLLETQNNMLFLEDEALEEVTEY